MHFLVPAIGIVGRFSERSNISGEFLLALVFGDLDENSPVFGSKMPFVRTCCVCISRTCYIENEEASLNKRFVDPDKELTELFV